MRAEHLTALTVLANNLNALGAQTTIDEDFLRVTYRNIPFFVYYDGKKFELNLDFPTEKRSFRPDLGVGKDNTRIQFPTYSGTLGNEKRLLNRVDTDYEYLNNIMTYTENNYLASLRRSSLRAEFENKIKQLAGGNPNEFPLLGTTAKITPTLDQKVKVEMSLTLEEFQFLLELGK